MITVNLLKTPVKSKTGTFKTSKSAIHKTGASKAAANTTNSFVTNFNTNFFNTNFGQRNEELQKSGVSKLLVLFLGCGFLFLMDYIVTPRLKKEAVGTSKEVAKLENEIKKQTSLNQELKIISEDKQIIDNKIKIFELLNVDRQKEIKALDAIQTSIPEKAWLTEINYLANKMTLKGCSITGEEVNVFMDRLSKVSVFSEVVLVGTAEQLVDKRSVKFFEITFKVSEQI